jgi:glycerate dehydrogenase
MKIVVLDGYTLNPGDLSWDALRELGDCTIYDRTPAEAVIERASGAQVLLTNKVVLSAEIISQLPDLRYIGVLATGYNVVDIAAARERGIPVSNVPVYGTRSVAQMAFALLLELTQHVGHHSQTVRDGRWTASDDFCYWDYPMIELADRTMGIVGFGRIGQATGALAQAFGMNVIANDAYIAQSPLPNVEMIELDDLFGRADAISLHCNLTPDNTGMVNAARLALMKPTAYLINTSRGQLVDADDLAAALNAGQIAGAGLDVLTVEPPAADNPLLTARNCIVTPHISWATGAARARLLGTVTENVRGFMVGSPRNVVN